MIFNRFAYFFLFLLPASILFRVVPARWRPWVCTVSGSAFFVYFSVTELAGWWGAACLAIFFWEAMISRFYFAGSRWCIFGSLISLAALGVFKYWNFAIGLGRPLGVYPLYWPGSFLPLGISFFTFEFIHYAMDRYRNRTERGSLAEYLAFIFFFPTMVAGPIKRFQDFLPCLRSPSQDWPTDWNRGWTRILTGLAKKFVLADTLTSLTDHLNTTDIAQAERWALPVWLLAFGWKIYFDFSAYSDIAIGSGRLFGLQIPENFNWPYFRLNIASFWQHWHVSLYRWLVDYLFIPMGGSRGGLLATCRNIVIIMLVSGLWHGAGTNFLVWGLWHGLLLTTHRLWTAGREHFARREPPGIAARRDTGRLAWLGKLAAWLLTYVSVNLGWAFFIMDLDTAIFFFRRLLVG